MTAAEYRAHVTGRPATRPLAVTASSPVALAALPFVVDLPMPPSVNRLWVTAKDRDSGRVKRFLSTEARAYRREIAGKFTGLSLEAGGLYRLLWLFGYPWYFKNGKLRRHDAPNYVKFLEDCVARFAGVDDSQFKEPALFEHDTGAGGDKWVRLAITPWEPAERPSLLGG